MIDKIRSAFLGLAVGDALGVPVEFMDRAEIAKNPVTGMRSFGTHGQPAGTWSDDSSLTFCLAEALCEPYDLKKIARNFTKWYDNAYWTAHGEVFDVGIATARAIRNLGSGVSPLISGNTGDDSNGNGSLMRILPVVFYTATRTTKERFECVAEISGITHAHIRSIVACFIYTELALELLSGEGKHQAYANMQRTVNDFLQKYAVCDEAELHKFHRILENPYGDYEIRPLLNYPESEIQSTGYVLHTLEASLWCFLKYHNWEETVLKAVNLGKDTDTTGCVTGGLAGLYYGSESIPKAWLEVLAKRTAIEELAGRFAAVLKPVRDI